MGTALERHQAQPDIGIKAHAYGIPGKVVDGMDIMAVKAAVMDAAESVRETHAPLLLEARTYRFRAHSMYDAELYRTKEEVEEWKRRDPIVLFQRRLREMDLLSDADLKQQEESVAAEVADAVAAAESGPWEPAEDLTKDVYTR
jgi:TPP-dependent pyruvate/acetoin dehydrogenase alpha subunit